jgi:5-methylcytosine-specific restriction endonuclease McrA
MPRKPARPLTPIDCVDCGRSTPRTSKAQKRCPECGLKHRRAYMAEYRRAWHAVNPGKHRQYHRNRIADPAKRAAYAERQSASAKKRYAANRERMLAVSRRWAASHPERLIEYAHRQRAGDRAFEVIPRDWRRLLERYRHCCAYCGTKVEKLQREHVIPLSRGGVHSIGNLVPACPKCNTNKKNRLLIEWKALKLTETAECQEVA